ncbi:MAG: aminopeptidase [Epulopiscium sp.]|nr:aminopeptidase [Candidatus Epulonipiscium sp.]
MNQFQQNLEKYAELAIKIGVNIQKNQELLIMAPIETADFVRKVVKKAYESGAKNVHVEWSDEEITRTKFLLAPEESFKNYPIWKAKGYIEMAKRGCGVLSISASNPDLLKDIDPKKIALANKASAMALQEFRDYMQNNIISWAIVSIPTTNWALKIFPNETTDKAIEKLWNAIFHVTRIDTKDPIKAWEDHLAQLNTKLTILNRKKYKTIYFKAPGTDLAIDLPKGHIWWGADAKNANGDTFIANIPTEEIYTVPAKYGVNGTVCSTKPLNYHGTLIDNFSLTFKDGKVIDFTAETGYETLKNMLETDEEAKYLGEVALVPDHSPISNSNILFYNTLFDENASCHLALGSAYPVCLEKGETLSKEELDKRGCNSSLIHVDFMIGSADMSIDGETEGGIKEPIFRNGNWAF